MILVSGVKEQGGVPDDLVRAWQQYGELMGMPPYRMAATLENLLSQPRVPAEHQCVRLLHEVGFSRVPRFFSTLGVITGWIARQAVATRPLLMAGPGLTGLVLRVTAALPGRKCPARYHLASMVRAGGV